jgi:hypothetical protein
MDAAFEAAIGSNKTSIGGSDRALVVRDEGR